MIRTPKGFLRGAGNRRERLGPTRRRTSSILVIGFVILGAGFGVLFVADRAVALHWCPSLGGGYDPSVFYQGVSTTFTITVVNNIGDPITVANVMVDFDWDGDTSSNGWDLDFGPGTVPPGDSATFSQSITPPSATPGTYQVEVQVRGSAPGDGSVGACNFLPGNVELRSLPPLSVTASGTPTSGNVPLPVAFSATVSGGSSPYSYSWTFGDGGTSTAQNPGHTYGRPGTYIARVTVQDSVGSMVSRDVTITVTVQSLIVTAQADPTEGDAPLDVSFSVTVSGGLTPYTYQWMFGDGSASTSQSVVHRYTAPGTYGAQVTVRDSLGSSVSSSVSVLVRPSAPQVSMLASLQSGVAPLTISFSATITGGVRPDSYAWDFGDGGTSTEESPTHRYDRAGTYIVTVTTTDALGRTATDTETIDVQAPPAGVFSFESPVLWILVGGIGVTLVSVLLVAARKRGKRKRASRAARWRVNESDRR